jgi:DnaA N-terminal domain
MPADYSPERRALQAVLGGRTIAYNANLARVAGSVTAGVFLAQLLYWYDRGADPEGWIWKTQPEWEEETALGRREQETARKQLVARGLLTEKRAGVPAQLHFRLNMERLIERLAELPTRHMSDDQIGGIRQSRLAESADQERRIPPTKNGGERRTTNTERTSLEDSTKRKASHHQKTLPQLPLRDPLPTLAEAPEAVWPDVLALLREQASPANYTTYLVGTQLITLTQDLATIQAPDRHQAEWLAKRWPALLERALAARLGRRVRCQVVSPAGSLTHSEHYSPPWLAERREHSTAAAGPPHRDRGSDQPGETAGLTEAYRRPARGASERR